MKFASRRQNLQDWLTQQWAILWGNKIDPEINKWILGPFGKPRITGSEFVNQIIKDENLFIDESKSIQGLIPCIDELKLSEKDRENISDEVKDFYERSELYELDLTVNWNPIFMLFGKLINLWFSNRISQLNIPAKNITDSQKLKSEIITLSDKKSKKNKYTIWYRTFLETGKVMYSGIYSTCTIPSGKTCIKACFPLPNGNATVIMEPRVGLNGQFTLITSGKKFGDTGFYFLLNDSKGNLHSQYIRSFRNRLTFEVQENGIMAKQILTLWNLKVLQFNYKIRKIN